MWMQSLVWALVLAAGGGLAASAPADDVKTVDAGSATPSGVSAATKERIDSLIRDLGSAQFAVRRAASAELRRIGPDAFDSLFAATHSPDPEVAASANYLLRQISVRWVSNDDPPAVRRILKNYGESADAARLSDVLELALLPKREGLAALCRIARFDRSPLVSRKAALAVIRTDLPEAQRTPIDPQVVHRELGPSGRVGAVWLRQFCAQLREPAVAAASWQRLIDEEENLVLQNSDETAGEILLGLLWNLADLHRQLDNRTAFAQTVEKMVRTENDDPEQVAVAVLMWLVEEKAWQPIDDLVASHNDIFSQGKKPLYAVAHARWAQGRFELADKLAEQASHAESSEPFGSFEMAKDLEYRGRFEWAAREYHTSIDDQRVESPTSIVARVSLASLLHDHERDQEAAEVLAPLIKALPDPKLRFDDLRTTLARQFSLNVPDRSTLNAQYHFYLAGQHRTAKDWKQEREELDRALRYDREDSDVLIAMYRLPEADETYREQTRQKIADLARAFQQKIDAAPKYAPHYNQWAWLIANTEGDYHKAIEYSHRSLELNTLGESAEASYLDTLGRCYYAVGDYENAVKYQRQAVERVGYMQTMKRQLALFEAALAEQLKEPADSR